MYFIFMFFLAICYEAETLAVECKPICAKPESVQDYCSNECEIVQCRNDDQLKTYINDFGWICDKAFILDLIFYLDFFGAVFGSIVGVTLSNRKGRRYTLRIGLALAIAHDFIVLSTRNEYIIILNSFMVSFYTVFIRCSCTTMVFELLPSRYVYVVITIMYVSLNIGKISTVLIWHFLHNWYKISFIKIGFSSCLLIIVVAFVPESPRWTYNQNYTARTIKTLEKIARFNKEPTFGIASKVEKCWRRSRCLPPARESFSGIFYYPFLTKLLLQIMLISTGYYIITKAVTSCVLDANFQLINPVMEIIGTVCWSLLINFMPRKMSVVYGYCSLLSLWYISLSISQMLPICIIGKLIILNMLYIALHIEMMILEAFPTSVRSAILSLESVCKKFGLKIIILASREVGRGKSLENGAAYIAAIIGLLTSFQLIDTRGSLMPISTRDAESSLKLKLLGINEYGENKKRR